MLLQSLWGNCNADVGRARARGKANLPSASSSRVPALRPHATRHTDTTLNCETAAHKTENEQRLGTHAHAATKTELNATWLRSARHWKSRTGPHPGKFWRHQPPRQVVTVQAHKKRTGGTDHVRPASPRRRSYYISPAISSTVGR